MPVPAETRHLYDCIRASLGVCQSQTEACLAAPVADWGRLVAHAERNGLAPLLYHHVKKGRLGHRVPEPLLDRLRRWYYRVAVDNTRYEGALNVILWNLRRAGLPVIVLKGAALAGPVWGNLALRSMSDLDLLVREADLERAQETLASLDFRPEPGRRTVSWYRERHHHLAPLHWTEGGLTVEIHHSIVRQDHGIQVDVAGLWKRARPERLGDASALVLSAEDLLIHLCLHVAVDEPFVGKMRGLLDIALVVQGMSGRIDWDAIVRRARAWRCRVPVYYALQSAADLLDAPVEAGAREALRRGVPFSAWEDRLLRAFIGRHAFLDDHTESLVPPWVLQEVCAALLSNASPGRKFLDLLRHLVRPPSPSRTPAPGDDDARRFGSRVIRLSALTGRAAIAWAGALVGRSRSDRTPGRAVPAGREA